MYIYIYIYIYYTHPYIYMGEESGVYRVLVGKPEERDHWGDLGVDG